MDREAMLDALRVKGIKQVAKVYPLRVTLQADRLGRRTLHLFHKTKSLCGSVTTTESETSEWLWDTPLCRDCYGNRTVQDAVATALRGAWGVPLENGPHLKLTTSRRERRERLEQPELPREYLPTGSGKRGSFPLGPGATSGQTTTPVSAADWSGVSRLESDT
jgi:hypothetical protein